MPKRPSLTLLLLALTATLTTSGACARTTDRAIDPRIDRLLSQLGRVQPIDAVAISPDGRQLAWVIERDGKSAIEVADADGRHVHAVSAAVTPGRCDESGIAWAPDSRQLAFIANCHVDLTSTRVMRNDIYLADPGGNTPPRRLAQLQGYVRSLQWTADGRHIGFLYVAGATRHASAVAAARRPSGEIGVAGVEVQRVASIDAANGALRELTPAGIYAYEFDWSPDGSRIAYTAAQPPGDNNW